jgi:trk/ktr system potassium uptake protein
MIPSPKAPTLAAPPRTVAPPPGVLARARLLAATEWSLLLALILVLVLDFVWPLAPAVSLVLLGLLTALVLPWGWIVLHGGRRAKAAPSSLKVWLFRALLLALVATFVGAKWWLRFGHGDVEPSTLSGTWRSYSVALLMLLPLGLLGKELRFSKVATAVADHPARLMALSFGAAGLTGGLLLSLPPSMQRVHELSIVDNLFMSFSAVCVTGLSVNTLSQTYTLFGQVVLCLLIQIGGLGIMVLSAAVGLLTGQRMRIKSSAVLAEIVDSESLASLRRVVLAIVTSTFAIEAAGALFLYARFKEHPDLLEKSSWLVGDAAHPGWLAVFHAVSGFCNAGFSNLHPGLVPFVGDPVVMVVMVVLIVLGGIGFPVIHELWRRLGLAARRRRLERLSLHTRISLRATVILLAGVTLIYLVLEWNRSFAALSWGESLLAALFQSASCRTAGFNVIDVGAMQPASLMLTCVAMFIGACSGSCAGGIKTTTLAALFAGLRAELQGRPPYLLDRSLPTATIRKAIGVAFMSIALVSTMLFMLLLVESHPPLALAFEAFSAFSTTGLSTGITPQLSAPGKLLVLLTMYMGRIGPLTLALALSRRLKAVPVQVPEERVLIG